MAFFKYSWVYIVVGVLFVAETFAQFDPPHDVSNLITCFSCHINPATTEGAITNSSGNAKLCLSCHSVGGFAQDKPLSASGQAILLSGLPPGVFPRGTSHRWDSSISGYALFIGGATNSSSGQIKVEGVYTGNYSKTYTITIKVAGESGTALFDWVSTPPYPGSGVNVLSGTNISLSDGVVISFVNGASSPSFQYGDKWYIFVRPKINIPTNSAILSKIVDGKIKCSTCHDQHSQANQPFDPSAPQYSGAGSGYGRHLMRINNDSCQLCIECHFAFNATNSSAGTHPVGIQIPQNGFFKNPSFLPLDKTQKIQCLTCHKIHNSPVDDGMLLRTNATALCLDCHLKNYAGSAHLSRNNGVIWLGGEYGSFFPPIFDATKRGSCINCHSVHGFPNTSFPDKSYPGLLVELEEKLCITCHDGAPAKNVKDEFPKPYRHPVTTYTDRHSNVEYSDTSRYGITNRHSECVDCHNPHQTAKDTTQPAPPFASANLKNVARVSVVNVSSNLITYIFRPPSDPTPVKEYELCFTCHSSFTTQPSGQSNFAAKFNDKNPSFHPVESIGKNTNININAFTNGWRADKLTYCTDCHTSDNTTVRGPHGSQYSYILKKPYTASSAQRTMANNEICFDCHNYDTYANNNASNTIKGYSRFNPPSFNRGHTYHVGSRRYPCYACHETHGSTNRPALIVTGRSPGLNNYTQTANGGSCSPTCHGSQSYTINYAR